jgi:hypothetical protein
MIKLIVEIAEVKDEANATNIALKVEKELPTETEKLWERRIYPALKDLLGSSGLLGDRAN